MASCRFSPDGTVDVLDVDALRNGAIDRLIASAVFSEGPERDAARWIIRAAAAALGVWPASIHGVYMAAGRGEYSHRTAPAINVRALAFDTMRAIFRAAMANDCKIVLFELARSEMAYTQQRPGEYASNVLAAAIKEGYTGPVFIQGDHYQISAQEVAIRRRRKSCAALKEITAEAIAAGYFNIDVDASTVVDLELPTLAEQQQLNAHLTALFTEYIRDIEPEGVTVSIGGEIGEVGLRNSTVEDLFAFMNAYLTEIQDRERALGSGTPGRYLQDQRPDRDIPRRRHSPGRHHRRRRGRFRHPASALRGGAQRLRHRRRGPAWRIDPSRGRLRQVRRGWRDRGPPRHRLPDHGLRARRPAVGPARRDLCLPFGQPRRRAQGRA